MNDELKKTLDDFILEFEEIPSVKQYLLLKKEIEEDVELQKLHKEMRDAQKSTALSIGNHEVYEVEKARFLSLKEKYENNPKIVNLTHLKPEVKELLDYLVKTIK